MVIDVSVSVNKANILGLASSVAFFSGCVYLISTFNEPQYAFWLAFGSLGLAILGLPLAAVAKKKGEFVFLPLGLYFLADGTYYIYAVVLPSHEETLLGLLLGFAILGMPMALLSLSIFFLWRHGRRASRRFELAQYALCLLLHVANVIVWALYPLGDITRFGGAILAVVFGLLNFGRLLRRSLPARIP